MKTKLSLIATAVATLLLTPVSRSWGQQPAPVPPPLVSTNGSAQIRVVPDLADLYFEVEIRNADLAAARKQQTERSAKVLAALRAAGVVETELQTSQVELTPDYTDDRTETEKVKFFRVYQSISCTIHDMKKVSDVTEAAIKAGATGVREAVLRTSQFRKFRDEARAKAVLAAKEKAEALAKELGSKIGKPYTITEGSPYESHSRGNFSQNAFSVAEPPSDGAEPSFAPGTISINASVSVSFLLE